MVTAWILGMTATAAVSFLIGRLSIHDKWAELVADKRIAAAYGDQTARAWLDRQARKPSAEQHIQHLHAVAAGIGYAVKAWFRKPKHAHKGWDGDSIQAVMTATTRPSNILPRPTWPTDLLPANAFLFVRLP